MTTTTAERRIDIDDRRLTRLRILNVVMGLLHLASGAAMVVLGNDFSIDVSSFALDGPPGTPLSEGTLHSLFGVNIAWATASFSFLSAGFHLLVAAPGGFTAYADELRHGRNRFRWVEYSLSATIMILLIALLTGITDLAALVAIAAANVAMILFGWVMEMVNRPGERTWWTPFWFGCVAGAGPWIAIVTYLAVNISRADSTPPPGFVYGIIATLFVLFNCFALNQWLQYRGRGRWADYVFGESVYVVLSLAAKLTLAWQVFANVLVD